MADFEGNSEGSIYLGQDGNAYQVINGKSVQVSKDKLIVAGYKPITEMIIGGKTYRNTNGVIYLVENGKLTPVTDAQELARLAKIMESEKANQNYLIYGGIALVVLLLLTRR
jgi:hypothetical protein